MLGTEITLMRPMLGAVMGDAAKRFLDHTREIIPPVDLTGPCSWDATAWNVTSTSSSAVDVIREPHVGAAGVRTRRRCGQYRRCSTFRTMRPVLPANLLGLPAAVVPVGIADGPARRSTGDRPPSPTCAASPWPSCSRMPSAITPIDPTW
ncbi:MAG: hypothetical protein R2713_18550 [Ilumatobacteraceae bacterium]